jgi:hypothetical protein
VGSAKSFTALLRPGKAVLRRTRRASRRPPLAPPDVEVPHDRQQSTIRLTGEDRVYPGVAAFGEQTSCKQAVSRSHVSAPPGGLLVPVIPLEVGPSADGGDSSSQQGARVYHHPSREAFSDVAFALPAMRHLCPSLACASMFRVTKLVKAPANDVITGNIPAARNTSRCYGAPGAGAKARSRWLRARGWR